MLVLWKLIHRVEVVFYEYKFHANQVRSFGKRSKKSNGSDFFYRRLKKGYQANRS
jgi:hypothetical protein